MTADNLVGVINHELLELVTQVSSAESKTLHIKKKLDAMFGTYDWTKSFSTPQSLVYDDVLLSDTLVDLHHWLRSKSADIENIELIVTHHTGVKNWWQQWCQTNHERSFAIRELFLSSSPAVHKRWFARLSPLPQIDFFRKEKKISKYFSYYGGSYATLEREYLLLKMLQFRDIASIEFIGQFGNKKQLLDYVEQITYFKKQNEIDYIDRTHSKFIINSRLVQGNPINSVKDEKISFSGHQWSIDKICFASVVRETINNDRFACLTEKTIRAFLHHCVVVPIGYQAVHDLELLGFWFPHDIFDYSYQDERCFSERVEKLASGLEKMYKCLSIDRLQKYYIDNLDRFHGNSRLVFEIINTNNQRTV